MDIKISRDEQALLLEAAILYRDKGRMQESREILEGLRPLGVPPDLIEVQLGLVAWQEGKFDQAAAHYQQALTQNPKSVFALVHLGEVELFRRNGDAAKRYLRQTQDLDPRGAFGKLARSLMALA